jgi:hypothetical protein
VLFALRVYRDPEDGGKARDGEERGVEATHRRVKKEIG